MTTDGAIWIRVWWNALDVDWSVGVVYIASALFVTVGNHFLYKAIMRMFDIEAPRRDGFVADDGYGYRFARPGSDLGNTRIGPTASGGKSSENGLEHAGRYIGALERLMTLLFVLSGDYFAIGAIFAAKSIVRFEKMKERKWAEYFLVGSMTSITLAILVGLATRWVISRL